MNKDVVAISSGGIVLSKDATPTQESLNSYAGRIGQVALGDINNDNKKFPNGSDKFMKNPIEIIYKNWKGEVGNRIILPYELWYGESKFHQGNQWFLTAYDIAKQDIRQFAINDIIEYIKHEEDWFEKDNNGGNI